VNCAVNIPGSTDPRFRGRGTDHFEFTPFQFGSNVTGWAPCASYRDGVTYDDAIGISAAALNSQGGVAVPIAARLPIAALNLGLGFWLRNPRYAHETGTLSRFRTFARVWTLHSALETLALNAEDDAMVLVSDGGHHDNLGLVSLVRRRVPVIVCVDAAADPDYRFTDLGRTLHLLREEGWECIGLKVDAMKPASSSASWADRIVPSPIQIFWLKHCDGSAPLVVVYVKSAVTSEAPYDIRAYAESEARFPQQTTLDQVFDGWQFDAYFSVGRHLASLAAQPIVDATSTPCPTERSAADPATSHPPT
jgi:hypothetical protein